MATESYVCYLFCFLTHLLYEERMKKKNQSTILILEKKCLIRDTKDGEN